jgi:hypothetical protein
MRRKNDERHPLPHNTPILIWRKEAGGRGKIGIVSYILTNRFEGDLAPCYAMLCYAWYILTYAIGA